jgi:sodium/proline symporter
MFFAIVIVPALVIYQAGGWTSSINSLNEANPYYLNIFTNAKDGSAVSFLTDIISNVGWGLGYFGMPHILVRFMAIKSPRQITESRRIAMTWVVVSLAAAIAVGVLGHIFASQHGVMVKDSEEIFMLMIKQLFHPAIVGVMMSAILAAIMSTADSQLLVSASAFSNDIYKKWIHKNASNKELVIVSRISVGIIAVIAAFIAAADPESDFLKQVMALVSFAWAGFGAAFGPVILLALFWKRTNIYGAGAGMVIGALTAIIWKFVLAANFPEVTIFKLYEIVPGFLLSLITIVVVSLLTKAPSKEITDEFEKVASNDL